MQKLFQVMSLGVLATSILLSSGTPSTQAVGLCEDTSEYVFNKGSEVVRSTVCGADGLIPSGQSSDVDTFLVEELQNAQTLDFTITLANPEDAGKLYYTWEYYGNENAFYSGDEENPELNMEGSVLNLSFPSVMGVDALDESSTIILLIYSYTEENLEYAVEFTQDGVAVEEPTETTVPTGDLRIDSFTYENGIASLTVSTDLDTIVIPEGVSVLAQYYAIDAEDNSSKIFLGRRVLNKDHEDFLTPGVSRKFNTYLYREGTSYERKMNTLLEGGAYKLVVQLVVKDLETGENLTSSYDVDMTDASNFARVKGLVVKEGRLQ